MTLMTALPAEQRAELVTAVSQLERNNFIARLAQYAGTPVDAIVRYLPRSVNERLRSATETAILKCVDVAVNSLEEEGEPPANFAHMLMTGVTGSIGGFIGILALPFELPLTTSLMLRSIAEIARAEGEDLADLEARMACIEVFAMGSGRNDDGGLNFEYYAVRAVVAEFLREASRYVLERGAINASTPIVIRFVGEIVSRFGFAISERFASSAVPVLGAAGGAVINMVFMDHFQRVARGHFTVRRLERQYGAEIVRAHYRAEAARLNPSPQKRAHG